jgi:hypothetical protein
MLNGLAGLCCKEFAAAFCTSRQCFFLVVPQRVYSSVAELLIHGENKVVTDNTFGCTCMNMFAEDRYVVMDGN